ncbi:hypothetical protein XPA_010545 [Xanthoria parietina]
MKTIEHSSTAVPSSGKDNQEAKRLNSRKYDEIPVILESELQQPRAEIDPAYVESMGCHELEQSGSQISVWSLKVLQWLSRFRSVVKYWSRPGVPKGYRRIDWICVSCNLQL